MTVPFGEDFYYSQTHDKQVNRSRADWLIEGLLPDGRHFVVAYDHPHGLDRTAVRIVSVWDF